MRRNMRALSLALLALWLAGAAGAATLIVPDQYTNIQNAVYGAVAGDVIQIRPGTYHEALYVDRQVSFVGEDPANTIVDALGSGNVFNVRANGVNISGLTIRGGHTGIDLYYADYCTFSNLVLTHNYYGMFTRGADHNMLRDSLVVSNEQDGVNYCDWGSRYNTLLNVDISGQKGGVVGYRGTDYLEIIDSRIHDNEWGGVTIGWSRGWVFEDTAFVSNGAGVSIDTAWDGLVKNCEIQGNDRGVTFWGLGASGNWISSNNIVENRIGVEFQCRSRNNYVVGNEVINNDMGLFVTRHPDTYYACYDNRFYHNRLIGNTTNAYVPEDRFNNYFDNGYPEGGNYWDDYDGADGFSGPAQDQPGSDGFGDTPHPIAVCSVDNYPLFTGRTPIDLDIHHIKVQPNGKPNVQKFIITGTFVLPEGYTRADLKREVDVRLALAANEREWTQVARTCPMKERGTTWQYRAGKDGGEGDLDLKMVLLRWNGKRGKRTAKADLKEGSFSIEGKIQQMPLTGLQLSMAASVELE